MAFTSFRNSLNNYEIVNARAVNFYTLYKSATNLLVLMSGKVGV